jgi:aryl-alcohol dehydrogenase-like predicted oxidoreductase
MQAFGTTRTVVPAELVVGGSWVWRHAPSPESFDRVLNAARDEGIRWIDTSPVYGECERLALGWRLRHGAWFSPVVKLPVNQPEIWAPRTFEAAALEACRALGLSVAPILLLHGPPQSLVQGASSWWPDAMAAICALRDKGLAERVGVAAELPVVSAVLDHQLDVVQVPMNLADPEALEALAPAAARLGVKVMAARALANCVWNQAEPPAAGYTAEYSRRWRRRGEPPTSPPPLEAAIRFITHAGPHWAIFSSSRPEHIREVATLARRGPLVDADLHLWQSWAGLA